MILSKRKCSQLGAVLIERPKWCGKSTISKKYSKSIIEFQDGVKKVIIILLIKLNLHYSDNERPLLIDEWQMYSVVWDAIRNKLTEDKIMLKQT